ncbi:MAG: ribonuclease HII [Desulfotalea sp.]
MKNNLTLTADPDNNYFLEEYLLSHGYKFVAGTDEVGRGPLAGPVIAAAVILPAKCDHSKFVDSKTLSHKKLLERHSYLLELCCPMALGIVSEKIIDKINILQASLLAMKKAVKNLEKSGYKSDFLLVDGKFEVPMSIAQSALIKGESKSSSIAAASILAKVTRDEYMMELHHDYPEYGFNTNKGYPTKKHRQAIIDIGPCSHHRVSFRGVKEYVNMEKKYR